MSASVELVHLRKTFGDTVAVNDLSLTVASGEFFTLLGSSGSGKTTTLMMIAGFLAPDRGEIRIRGRSVVNLPPERRDVGVVFQSYALFPHMTVGENVAFPLRMRRIDRETRSRKVRQMLELVNLEPLANRRIAGLSGGEQQRVALARALVFEPPLLLMDEPLGALDRKLREQLQIEIKRIQSTLGVTVIYVTHDQEEALVLSDRIAIMADGDIRQMGPIAEMYERPQSLFVAQFLGESNVLDGRIEKMTDGVAEIELQGAHRIRAPSRSRANDLAVKVMMRPEALSIASAAGMEGPPRSLCAAEPHPASRDQPSAVLRPSASCSLQPRRQSAQFAPWSGPSARMDMNALDGAVTSVEFLGSSIRYGIDTAAGALSVRVPRTSDCPRANAGDRVVVFWRPIDTLVFPL